MKKYILPSAHTILLILVVATAILTWVIPAGKYETLLYEKTTNTFLQTSNHGTTKLPATQKTLDSLAIKIPLASFVEENIQKPINIPNTFTHISQKPQGFFNIIIAPIKGIIDAADVIFFVLILGGIIGIMNYSGAFDAGISRLSIFLRGHEYWLIIVVMTLVALGGTTFGLAEETIAFYPLLLPVFLAAGYDAIVGIAAIFLGSCIGTMCSTVNPFSNIIASNVAGVNWTTGIEWRFFSLFLGLLICISYTLYYASRIRKKPSTSIVFQEKEAIEKRFGTLQTENKNLFNFRMRLALIIFLLCFILMIYGVSSLGWWFSEMSGLFFLGSIIIGFIIKINEKIFWEVFIKGAGELLGVAIIIGIARGVSILMADGLISDTILHYASTITVGASKEIFINLMMFIFAGLSFFIPSSSGMAVLTMPIFAPLSDTVGVGRDVIVTAYQFGMGLFSFINPTSLILATLAVVNIGYNKWLQFVWPLVLILTAGTIFFLTLLAA